MSVLYDWMPMVPFLPMVLGAELCGGCTGRSGVCAGKGSWRCPLVTAHRVGDLHPERGAGPVAAVPAGGDDVAGGVAGWCSAPCATWDSVCDFRSLCIVWFGPSGLAQGGKKQFPCIPKGSGDRPVASLSPSAVWACTIVLTAVGFQ